jgi:H(+)-translocating pyrophosphatase
MAGKPGATPTAAPALAALEVNLMLLVVPGLVAGLFSVCFAFCLRLVVMAKPTGKDIGHPKIDKLAAQVKSGAKAFLQEEYKYLAVFVLALGFLLGLTFAGLGGFAEGLRVVIAFVSGAALSAAAGWFGMSVATDGNSRTTVACTRGTLNDGLKVAFTTGAVMGFTVVGLGLGGLSCITAFLVTMTTDIDSAIRNLSAFGFGASSIALFARVAGGIYTKAADVGADLVGKVEAGIDEDDPHNPAVIADNVGDNVGDVAGMGADLFESYVGSMIASMSLALYEAEYVKERLILPSLLSSAGIFCSAAGVFSVNTDEEGAGWNSNLSALMWGLEKGMYSSVAMFVVCTFFIVLFLFGGGFLMWRVIFSVLAGLFAGVAIGKATEYFTSFDFGPVISIKDRGITGPATVVIQGIGVGMISCLPTVLILALTIIICAALDGTYGVSISAVGMLATLGITLATDAYGPVADNAGGLAEMDSSIPKEVRGKTDALDALGNTTAATGKGFSIGSAVLTSLSLMEAFKHRVSPEDKMDFSIDDPYVLSGVLVGAMMPLLFAALTMISVGKAAAQIIMEVRRQFHGGVPGLYECIQKASQGIPIPEEEDVEPDSDKCVMISTKSSVTEMIAPGAYAILAPMIVGFVVGPRMLMGVLAGAIASGCMNAIMMNNAGGAWDNSKKLCEKLQIKKTDQGKACVVGDTVGDPFKDTSGPALNILIKLMSMVSLTMAPLIENHDDWQGAGMGIVPLAILVGLTIVLVQMEILGWQDPLSDLQKGAASGNLDGRTEAAAARVGLEVEDEGLELMVNDDGDRPLGHQLDGSPSSNNAVAIGHMEE